MNRCSLFACTLLVAVAAGCKGHRDAYMVEVFNAQNLILEDKIYELNDRIAALESRVESPPPREPRLLDDSDTDEPASDESSDEGMMLDDEIPDLSPPEVEPGIPTDPETIDPPDIGTDMSMHPASHVMAPEDTNVVAIVVAPETRPANFDGKPGEEGAWVVLEPQNAEGQIVPTPAKVSLGVRDVQTKERLGEWHFDAATVARSLRLVGGKPALVLQVRWDKEPQNQDLELGVVYYKEDGEKISARAPLALKTQRHVADHWTPRAKEARRAAPTGQQKPAPRTLGDEGGPGAEVYR